MHEDKVESFVRALVVALMNGLLYFPGHRRVEEAAEEAVEALDTYFEDNPLLVLSLREGQLVFEGAPLFDLSIFAHRFIRVIRENNGWGLRVEGGVAYEEVMLLVEFFLGTPMKTPAEANAWLQQKGVTHLALEEKAVAERSGMALSAASASTGSLDDQRVSREIYTGILSSLQDIMVELKQRKERVSFSNANEMAERLAEALQDNHAPFIALTSVKDYDSYVFNHSVNVCIYTAALAESLTTQSKEVVRIAQAALLHDVGKLLIAEEIVHKPGRLSEAEWALMRKHPALGAKILIEAKGVNELAVNVAFGHHLRHDRKGYPQLGGDIRLDPVTELVNVVDVYEALTARRPYKKPFSPERAAELLLKEAGSAYNPVCVEVFLRFYGIYPVGTQVRLDNGMKGKVISANPEDPFRPVVRVTHGPENEPLESNDLIDTAQQNVAGDYGCTILESVM